MRSVFAALTTLFVAPCFADVVVPTRTIRADAIILATDITLNEGSASGVFDRIDNVVGQEARIVLYAGRPIMLDQIGPPAIINRNQIVALFFEGSGVRIVTEARALERGGVGDSVRVMNLTSRTTLIGQVQADGTIRIEN